MFKTKIKKIGDSVNIGFQIPKEATSRKVVLAYFDLRKFSNVENSFDAKGTYQILNEMHEIITDYVERLGGYCLRYIGDNTLAVFESESLMEVFLGIPRIKELVDIYFHNLDLPSVLHVLLHIGQANIGLVGGKSNKRLDVSGEVLNELGYLMMRIDTSGNLGLFNSFCMSEVVYTDLEKPEGLKNIVVSDCKLFQFSK